MEFVTKLGGNRAVGEKSRVGLRKRFTKSPKRERGGRGLRRGNWKIEKPEGHLHTTQPRNLRPELKKGEGEGGAGCSDSGPIARRREGGGAGTCDTSL